MRPEHARPTVIGILVLVPAAHSQSLPVEVFGSMAQERLGSAVAGAGDVNADGVPDFVVGARHADPGNLTDAGLARVFSGSDGSLLFTVFGEALADELGSSVTGAGDVNGDGYDDVLVGIPGSDLGGTNSGAARVISGQNGAVLYTLVGDSSFDRYGSSVAACGDLDADGVSDFAVAALEDDFGGNDSGSVYVYSGQTAALLYRLDGENAEDDFGAGVADAGDVNGDGISDLIVGANAYGNPALSIPDYAGRASVFSGVDGALIFHFVGNQANGWLGESVDGVGDIDGDGFDDVIVGARFQNVPYTNYLGQPATHSSAGRVFVISGATGSPLYTLEGDAGGMYLGTRVRGVGDVDGDGTPDFGFSGAYQGPRVHSGADGTRILALERATTFDRLGDVNGDGREDLVLGDDLDDTVATNAGWAAVLQTNPNPLVATELCDGDGGDSPGCTPCPCANDAPASTTGGCLNGAGTSARLVPGAGSSIVFGNLRFDVVGANVNTSVRLASADNALPAAGTCPAGSGIASSLLDGLRCAGGSLVRHGVRGTDAAGNSVNPWGPPGQNPPLGIAAQGGFVVGQTRVFQAFYREDPALSCGTGQNTTNAVAVTFTF